MITMLSMLGLVFMDSLFIQFGFSWGYGEKCEGDFRDNHAVSSRRAGI